MTFADQATNELGEAIALWFGPYAKLPPELRPPLDEVVAVAGQATTKAGSTHLELLLPILSD